MAIRMGGGGSGSGEGRGGGSLARRPARGSKRLRDDEPEAEIVAEINITPLTDIFLVLLIIFMVTSSAMTNSGVDVNLPSASNEVSQSQAEGVVVGLLPGGKLQVNGHPVAAGDYPSLEAALKKAFTMTSSRLVILEGDKQAFLGSAVSVMDTARKAGAEKFVIATSSE